MKNADYWRRRAETLEESRYKRAKEQSDKAKKEFDLAQKTIDEQIKQWYARFAINNEITLAQARQWLKGRDLEEFKWDVTEYIKRGKQAASNPAFIKQLENASARFHISKLEALKLKTQATLEQLYGKTSKQAASFFGEVYKDNYYHTAFTLQKGFGVGWDISGVNQKQLESVLSKPWTLDRQTFSDRIWKQKNELLSKVHTQLTQNMILGKAPDDAIKAIAKKFNTSKSNAGRLVMTESAYFSIEAQKKAFEALDVEEYEIVATLDLHTSAICRDMDGQRFPMSQFEAGVTAPPFHPWCRSAVVPYFEDGEGKRAARDPESSQTYYVLSDMKYNDWKKSFVDGGDKTGLKKADISGILGKKPREIGAVAVQLIGKIDIQKYKCISSDIITDEVIITDERIKHIRGRHPNDYELFCTYLPQIVECPDYIIADTRPNTAMLLKKFEQDGERFRLSLRLVTASDNPQYKNSILTFMKIREKEWRRLLKNKKILYSKE